MRPIAVFNRRDQTNVFIFHDIKDNIHIKHSTLQRHVDSPIPRPTIALPVSSSRVFSAAAIQDGTNDKNNFRKYQDKFSTLNIGSLARKIKLPPWRQSIVIWARNYKFFHIKRQSETLLEDY